MISVNECETPMTASGQFDVENKYDLVLIKESEIQKANETNNQAASSAPEEAGVQEDSAASHVQIAEVGSNFVNIYSADEPATRLPEKSPILIDSVCNLAPRSKKASNLKRAFGTLADAARFMLFNHVSVIVYLMASAFFIQLYLMPELVSETVCSDTFDPTMKAAVLYVLFIYILIVYLSLIEKLSKNWKMLAIPLTWLFVACTFFVTMTLVKAHLNSEAQNMQLMSLALRSRQHEQELQVELQRRQDQDSLLLPPKTAEASINDGQAASEGFALPSFFSLFL